MFVLFLHHCLRNHGYLEEAYVRAFIKVFVFIVFSRMGVLLHLRMGVLLHLFPLPNQYFERLPFAKDRCNKLSSMLLENV